MNSDTRNRWKKTALLAALLVAAYGVYRMNSPSRASKSFGEAFSTDAIQMKSVSSPKDKDRPSLDHSREMAISAPPASATPSQTQAALKPKMDVAHPPSVSDLREEVKANVHVTPPSLIKFGIKIAQRMEKAKKSESEAASLMGDLGTCANPERTDGSPIQSRALCVVSARELGEIWPHLKEQSDRIAEKSDPATLKLVMSLGFMKNSH